jgi:acyl-coenzyme A synthetase/AMP-(fatty) acid ligase
VWKQQTLSGEQLMLVLRLEPGSEITPALLQDLQSRNRSLANYKRLSGYVLWDDDFPRTASMKIKRDVLADQIARKLDRKAALREL